MASSTSRRSASISWALMAFWAKMLREVFSRSAASSTLRVTLAFALAASSNSLKSNSICLLSRRFGNPSIGIEEQGLGDRIDDALRVFGERNVDSGGALDLAHLAQENIEDDAVDGVVGAVEQTRFDFGGHLAETVYPALALLQAVWIPGQIVVQDGSEELLQVDSFAEAVRGNEDARQRLAAFPRSAVCGDRRVVRS